MGVAIVIGWTSAYRFVVYGITVSSAATGLAQAGIQAQLIDALPIERTVVVLVTFGGIGAMGYLRNG